MLADEALLQLRADRVRFRPYGLHGGEPGSASRNILITDGQRRALPGKVTMTIRRNDVVDHEQAGGGGFGNPLERDVTLIREDVLDGKITPAYAREHYGVLSALCRLAPDRGRGDRAPRGAAAPGGARACR